MPNSVTATGKNGPAAQMNAVSFRNVTDLHVDIARSVISFGIGSNFKDIDLNGITNISITLNGQNSTISLS